MIYIFIISGLIYVSIQAALTFAFLSGQKKKKSDQTLELPEISVIIAARNEFDNLRKNLPFLLELNYSNYELIVVLDRCKDRSLELMLSLQEQHPQIKVIVVEKLPKGWSGKKWAIHEGIQNSVFAHLAFLDADCRPEKEWLNSLAKHFSDGYELILGVGVYESDRGLLNAFIQYETLYTCLQYIGAAKLGLPYMGVGRNLAYTKAFYTNNGGFADIKDKISGDDDLLVNRFAHPSRTFCMLENHSKTYSDPKKNWNSWIRQKIRHLSASPAYSLHSKILLGIFHLSHLLFYLSILFFLFTHQTLSLIWASYIGRIVISALLIFLIKKKLKIEHPLYLFPVLDLLYFIYNLSLVPKGYIQKRMAWS